MLGALTQHSYYRTLKEKHNFAMLQDNVTVTERPKF